MFPFLSYEIHIVRWSKLGFYNYFNSCTDMKEYSFGINTLINFQGYSSRTLPGAVFRDGGFRKSLCILVGVVPASSGP